MIYGNPSAHCLPQDAQQFNLNDVKAVRLETGKTKRDIMISGLGIHNY